MQQQEVLLCFRCNSLAVLNVTRCITRYMCASVGVFGDVFANGDALGNGVEVGVEVDALELDDLN